MQQSDKIRQMTLAGVEIQLKDRYRYLKKEPMSETKDGYEYSGYTIFVGRVPAFVVGDRKSLDHAIKDHFIKIDGKYFYYDSDEFSNIRKDLMSIPENGSYSKRIIALSKPGAKLTEFVNKINKAQSVYRSESYKKNSNALKWLWHVGKYTVDTETGEVYIPHKEGPEVVYNFTEIEIPQVVIACKRRKAVLDWKAKQNSGEVKH